MSTVHGGPGNIVTNGLVLNLDAANPRSFPPPYNGTVWRDLSGNNNSGSLTNGPTFNSANGGSIVFDGVDDYVNIGNALNFERTASFSLCAWINATSASNNQILNNENASYRGCQFSISTTSNIGFSLRNSTTPNQANIATVNTISTNTWYHVIATYNGSSNTSGMNIYINGSLQPVTTINNNLTDTIISGKSAWIGLREPITPGPFVGRIPYVQIYNRALSASEVLQNFNATRTRFGI